MVMVMVDAGRYGRMRMGRCLTSNSGSVGCSRDVLSQVDSVCSGQRTCRLDVRDLLIHNPCAKDLRGYLELRYTCLAGIVSCPLCCMLNAVSALFCWQLHAGMADCSWKTGLNFKL